MIRILTVAAAAAMLIAAPASAQSMKVAVAGKSTEQLHAEIVKAASSACWADLRGEPLANYLYPQCVSDSVHRAVAQIGDAKLVAFAKSAPAPVRFASR